MGFSVTFINLTIHSLVLTYGSRVLSTCSNQLNKFWVSSHSFILSFIHFFIHLLSAVLGSNHTMMCLWEWVAFMEWRE